MSFSRFAHGRRANYLSYSSGEGRLGQRRAMAVPVAAGFPLPHNCELYDDFEPSGGARHQLQLGSFVGLREDTATSETTAQPARWVKGGLTAWLMFVGAGLIVFLAASGKKPLPQLPSVVGGMLMTWGVVTDGLGRESMIEGNF